LQPAIIAKHVKLSQALQSINRREVLANEQEGVCRVGPGENGSKRVEYVQTIPLPEVEMKSKKKRRAVDLVAK